MSAVVDIAGNIAAVQDQIATACARAGRDPSEVTLVAVSKRKPTTDIVIALQAGITHLGESRVEEAQQKIPVVNDMAEAPPIWHMVGPVQGRKAKYMPALFDIVESVDSVKLAERLSRIGDRTGQRIPIFLEINISGEESKKGFAAHNWQKDDACKMRLIEEMTPLFALESVEIRGLMTLAPFYDNMEDTRPTFAALAALREVLASEFQAALPELSMGMTNDYPVAIEEGATSVRIGRGIFGPRD